MSDLGEITWEDNESRFFPDTNINLYETPVLKFRVKFITWLLYWKQHNESRWQAEFVEAEEYPALVRITYHGSKRDVIWMVKMGPFQREFLVVDAKVDCACAPGIKCTKQRMHIVYEGKWPD